MTRGLLYVILAVGLLLIALCLVAWVLILSDDFSYLPPKTRKRKNRTK